MIRQLISSAVLAVGTLAVVAGIRAVVSRVKTGQRHAEAADAVAGAVSAGEAAEVAAPDVLAARADSRRRHEQMAAQLRQSP